MGLGKTLSIISLIAHDKVLEKESGPVKSSGKILGRGTLLVLPPSLLHNWEEELLKHLSAEHFAWRCHHGRQRIQETSDVGFHDIVLTTYTTLAKEWQDQEQSQVFSHDWHRVVLDEGRRRM
ncbi:SNF2 family N-terminal domain-containing protein [Dactylonectria estremocensis]|uniref:SNF2 family N-terminal domain-containing protein n=1 Tax=Dactylonectria estremocensis TaxID=1079267 RepID=A0A9P9EYR6_9HYPO|nr:SNF2 family N-terminal domain-containing protein [Dactylonectria estremocensis]